MYKHVTLDDDEIEIQATWEIDMMHSGRSAHHDEVTEYEVTNWNSMFCPEWFAPTVLQPGSGKWRVKAIIHQSTSEGRSPPVLINVHPNSILPELAQSILAKMGLKDQSHRVTLMFEENGEVISPEWSLQTEQAGGYSSIGSMLMKTPVDISCIVWDP